MPPVFGCLSEETEAKFWSRVDRNGPVVRPELGPCWVWTAGRISEGYGAFFLYGRNHGAHRVSFFIEHGRWPKPACLHRCDNPACVRPDHLREGTHTENMREMVSRGRMKEQRGERNHAAKLSDEDVSAVRAAVAAGERHRAVAARYGVNQSTITRIVNAARRKEPSRAA